MTAAARDATLVYCAAAKLTVRYTLIRRMSSGLPGTRKGNRANYIKPVRLSPAPDPSSSPHPLVPQLSVLKKPAMDVDPAEIPWGR